MPDRNVIASSKMGDLNEVAHLLSYCKKSTPAIAACSAKRHFADAVIAPMDPITAVKQMTFPGQK